MPKTTREIKEKKSPLLLILFLIIVAGAGFALYKTLIPAPKVIEADDQFAWQTPPQEIETLSESSQEEYIPNNTEPSPSDVSPANTPILTPCEQISGELIDFFSTLKDQDYIKAYEIKEPLQDYSNTIIIKLLNNPPIISDETDDLFTVLKNTAHFYRVLGHKDLSLIKDILSYEQRNIEYLMGLFWEWSQTASSCPGTAIHMNFPLPKLYEYAGFFLNTLGGQSYLFRRDSTMRVLIKYYCMLVLDQASIASLNKYSIDEVSTLDSVIEEIEKADGLEKQDAYLANLMKIRARLSAPL